MIHIDYMSAMQMSRESCKTAREYQRCRFADGATDCYYFAQGLLNRVSRFTVWDRGFHFSFEQKCGIVEEVKEKVWKGREKT